MNNLLALLSGLIFGLGLVISGMADPHKVLGFLDISGAWDPSLALVMLAALSIAIPGFRWAQRRGSSLLGLALQIPSRQTIDRRLLMGAALFGIGWGMCGICPGPGILLLSTGSLQSMLFVLAMLAGISIYQRFS